jgi:hypothetical protein
MAILGGDASGSLCRSLLGTALPILPPWGVAPDLLG